MVKKKRIGLLTVVVFIAGTIMSIIDAVVSVTYGVVPEESTTDIGELVMNGPLWWKINPIILLTIIGVGVTAFLLGNDVKLSGPVLKKQLRQLAPVFLTFAAISFSGLGDVISQTFVELLSGNSPLHWLNIEWWWTMYIPVPAVIAFLGGHRIPTGTDMAIGGVVGVLMVVALWFYYYDISLPWPFKK